MDDKLAELGHDENDKVDKLNSDICEAIHFAIDSVLPVVMKTKRQKREVSQATKDLYDERSKGKHRTDKQFKRLQKKIKDAGMEDFKQWVHGQGEEMPSRTTAQSM